MARNSASIPTSSLHLPGEDLRVTIGISLDASLSVARLRYVPSFHTPFSKIRRALSLLVLTLLGMTSAILIAGERPANLSAAESLDRLKSGNARFMTGRSQFEAVTAKMVLERVRELSTGQKPFATIIGCSDSRVPIEFVFDQGLGELFVIRLAGNVIDPDVQGSVEYASWHLGTRLVVVMGHESCGAVTAALMSPEDRLKEAKGVQMLLRSIDPALKHLNPMLEGAERLQAGVEANVLHSIERILEFPGHREQFESGDVTIVGAVYELETGHIRWLED